ncbi:MAG TPA: MFS transporter, partial [Ktedonobacteraceae bacterium]
MARPRVSAFSAEAVQERSRQASSVPWLIFAACLTAVSSSIYYTDYSPLIPTMQTEIHINSGQAGLFSTLLVLGLAIAYIPAGLLIDRYGARLVLLVSTLVFTIGGLLLPLFPNVTWMLTWRLIAGIGIGGAFIAGAGVAAGQGRYAPLGLGLYGGSVQVGSGLGLLVTPLLLTWVGWRGSFLLWVLPGFISLVAWLFVNDGTETRRVTKLNLGVGLRSSAVWTLGLSHLGTFGLGNSIAP